MPIVSTGSMMAPFCGVIASTVEGSPSLDGELVSVPVAHSAYLNLTSISLHGDDVVLHGNESMVASFQIFESSTGKRLFDDVRSTF